MRRFLPVILIIAASAGLIIFYFATNQSQEVFKHLPIIGNHRLDTTEVNGVRQIDTIYHSIPDFHFTNQNGKEVDQSVVKGKVYVTDFFFTTCKTICPIMSKQMNRVYDAYKNNDQVMILSHTVDPETDTPAQLKNYADEYHADASKWLFLTGEKPALYDIARTGYLLDAQEGNGGAEDFIHTQNFALIDKRGRIRGYYDGTNTKEVDALITDIRFLLKE